MKETTKAERRGITWTLTNVLEDIDFADDICLLSQSHSDMQQKTNDLNANGGCLGFKTSTSKTKETRMNSKSREPTGADPAYKSDRVTGSWATPKY